MLRDDAFLEGRCLRCGQRVTADRPPDGHTRLGQWCGPIETHHPSAAPDHVPYDQWVASR
jgi:hypothetical protein